MPSAKDRQEKKRLQAELKEKGGKAGVVLHPPAWAHPVQKSVVVAPAHALQILDVEFPSACLDCKSMLVHRRAAEKEEMLLAEKK